MSFSIALPPVSETCLRPRESLEKLRLRRSCLMFAVAFDSLANLPATANTASFPSFPVGAETQARLTSWHWRNRRPHTASRRFPSSPSAKTQPPQHNETRYYRYDYQGCCCCDTKQADCRGCYCSTTHRATRGRSSCAAASAEHQWPIGCTTAEDPHSSPLA